MNSILSQIFQSNDSRRHALLMNKDIKFSLCLSALLLPSDIGGSATLLLYMKKMKNKNVEY